MKPVFQTIVDQGKGNCLSACFASILELSIDEVPTFVGQVGRPDDCIGAFLAPRGLFYLCVRPWDETVPGGWRFCLPKPCFGVLSVPSQRFPGGHHAVVASFENVEKRAFKWEIVHDPNPYNTPYGHEVDPYYYGFLVRGNPYEAIKPQ